MSIASRIESITENLENAYNSLENIGVDLTNINKNISNLSAQIESVYSDLPKITPVTGDTLTLSSTKKGKMELILKGNLNQETTNGTNYFNAMGIKYAGITVSDLGQTLTIQEYSKGNGYTNTNCTLQELCPTLKVGDVIYLYFTRVPSGYNNMIYIGGSIQWNNGTSKTITQEMLDSDVILYGNRAQDGETGRIKLIDFRMVKSTTAVWEKFTYGASPNPNYRQDIHIVTGNNNIIINGKNFFDKNNANILNYYMTSTGVIGSSINDKVFYIKCTPNTTYTIQKILGTSGRLRVGSFVNIPSVNDEPSVFVNKDNNTTATITTGANDNYLVVQYFASDENDQALLNSIQVEKNSTSTAYEAYQSQLYPVTLNNIELCEKTINNISYIDDIREINNKWYKHCVIGKEIIDENSNIKVQEVIASNYKFIWRNLNEINDDSSITANINCICNYFKARNDVYTTNDYIGFYVNNNHITNFSMLCETIGATTSQTTTQILPLLQTWLSTHNVIYYYILANPIDIEITDLILINQLNEIKKAKSYNNQTNISQTNDNLPFIISASALAQNNS